MFQENYVTQIPSVLVEAIKEAAYLCNRVNLLELSKQIPPDKNILAQALAQKAKSFDYLK